MPRKSRSDKPHGLQPYRKLAHPVTSEVTYSDEEIAFLKALNQYKTDNHRPLPTWCEVLAIVRSLGYRKIAASEPLPHFTRMTGGAARGHTTNHRT